MTHQSVLILFTLTWGLLWRYNLHSSPIWYLQILDKPRTRSNKINHSVGKDKNQKLDMIRHSKCLM
jgi:hypothetical protein